MSMMTQDDDGDPTKTKTIVMMKMVRMMNVDDKEEKIKLFLLCGTPWRTPQRARRGESLVTVK